MNRQGHDLPRRGRGCYRHHADRPGVAVSILTEVLKFASLVCVGLTWVVQILMRGGRGEE
jgi:hypothetical protein